MYSHAVKFEKVFISGHLKGLRLSDSLRFTRKADAIFFAKGDGLTFTAFEGSGDYRRENSVIERIEQPAALPFSMLVQS